MAINQTSTDIYLSRDRIRTQTIEYLQEYLELEGVDLTKSSFLSYMINIISTLTSNILFYNTSTYKEFFLTKAQLPESVLNLSAFLGYNTQEASYAIADVLLTIPFGFEDSTAVFYIGDNFKFTATDVQFLTYYTTTITVINNSYVKVIAEYEGRKFDIPVNIDTTNNQFNILLPVKQYKIVNQQFQIDADLQLYQFTELDVPITGSGQVASMTVVVTPPGGAATTYTEYETLYLMGSTDYGYVSRRTATGRKIYFGNGIIGIQPAAGSTVDIEIYETLGVDGNVIAGSINSGDRIYITVLSGQTKIVDYTVTNTSPAYNGVDEESTEDIRSNAIKNLVSMSRLVSDRDYKNINIVMPDFNLGSNSLAILKRSDVKCNEIQLYTTFDYEDDKVPMRNSYLLSTPPIPVYIEKYQTVTIDSEDYMTLFDMELDYVNSAAYYYYIVNAVNITPSLNITYNSSYDGITINELVVSESSGNGIFELTYTGVDSLAECSMEILESGVSVNMTNDSTSEFIYTFSPYTDFPEDEVTLYFTISSPSYGLICKYEAKVTFRKSLKSFMMSNVTSDSTSVIIYDVPVILKSYYDSISDKLYFEQQCMQKLIDLDFENYRMLTDFTNLKFTNTYGALSNMKYNTPNRQSVLNFLDTPPISPTTGERYIVGTNPAGDFVNHKNDYAQWTGVVWYFLSPITDDIVYVSDLGEKYIFTGKEWIVPEFTIPLEIELEVFKANTYFGSDSQLKDAIKTAIIDEFSERFGTNVSLYISELVSVIQSVTGVSHCNVVKPKSNIFFDFDLDSLTQQELMEFSPEYIFFKESNISITVI